MIERYWVKGVRVYSEEEVERMGRRKESGWRVDSEGHAKEMTGLEIVKRGMKEITLEVIR